MAEPSGRSTEEWAAQAERILAGLKERAGQQAPDGSFRHVTVAFTSDEVILLSNVLRRQEPGGPFTRQPAYATLFAKVEFAKCASFDWPMLGWPAALEDARELFPVTAERRDQEPRRVEDGRRAGNCRAVVLPGDPLPGGGRASAGTPDQSRRPPSASTSCSSAPDAASELCSAICPVATRARCDTAGIARRWLYRGRRSSSPGKGTWERRRPARENPQRSATGRGPPPRGSAGTGPSRRPPGERPPRPGPRSEQQAGERCQRRGAGSFPGDRAW